MHNDFGKQTIFECPSVFHGELWQLPRDSRRLAPVSPHASPICVHHLKSNNFFEAVCVGCPDACEACFIDEKIPKCVALSEAGIEHADSPGGVITVDGLVIHDGYWRATKISTIVLECYNQDACLGGVGIGNCNRGYEGPCEFLEQRATIQVAAVVNKHFSPSEHQSGMVANVACDQQTRK